MSKETIKKAVRAALSLLLSTLLIATLPPAAHAAGIVAASATATRSSQPIYVDSRAVPVTAYMISDTNYVRLRDIAQAVGFGVRYDSDSGTVHIATGVPYDGGASALGPTPERVDTNETRLPVIVDGRDEYLRAYKIGGNNYAKLRDIGAAVGFSVEWDVKENRVLIDTTKPYAPETQAEADIPGGTPEDYSLLANPAIFDNYYTRAKYNTDRQRVLETGTYVYWGTRRTPQSAEAVSAANNFFANLAHMSDLEKVHSINNFLGKHMTYKLDSVFSGDDFWTGMTYGVCEDYARAFQYMCYRAGLSCDFVNGCRSPAISTGLHSWNEVYFDGRWHFYDGTLSDSRGSIVLGDTATSVNTGYTYADDSPMSTMYRKEVYKPGSTL